MTPVRVEPAALWPRVKHSTTEPLRSQMIHIVISVNKEWMILTVVSLIEEWNGPYCDLSEEWMINTETPFRKGWMFLTVISVS